MNITIHRNGETYGPYTLDQVKEYLGNGTLIETDLAWHEGCKDWVSVKAIITPLSIPPPPPPSALNPLATTTAHIPQRPVSNVNEQIDVVGLSPYYQDEFRKIHESRETYQGKWNWAAFWFAGLWALVKGCWLSLIVWLAINIVVASITCGLGCIPVGVIYWFIYGKRGTYMHYCAYVKRRQIAF